MSAADQPRMLTVRQVCDELQIARATLYRITQPRGPLYCIRIGSTLRYPREAVEAYIAGERFDPADQAPIAQPNLETWPPTPSLWDTDQ